MPKFADWPIDIHPLNADDAERSRERVENIERGLLHPVDAGYWREKLEQRIEVLETERPVFGLVPHEEAELRHLKALRGKVSADA